MSHRPALNLLPMPRSLQRRPGTYALPAKNLSAAIKIARSDSAPDHPEGYALTISRTGIQIHHRENAGLRAAMATLRQIIRQCHGAGFRPAPSRARAPAPLKLPCLKIRDWPDFARRGVMLDVSRGRVPKLETLLQLVEQLADFKINEFQLYVEHTFAYRQYKSVWQSWSALTAEEIRKLDARCRELGIDLVPNQNSFGHLRYFLEDPRLKNLSEVSEPYESASGGFLRRPTTLAPNHPGTIPFLRGLYDELLPNFSSRFFNVGCDETWDLGRGQSKELCKQLGQGRVYLDFLKKIHREVSARGKTMMFWGDIILKYPNLIRALPQDVVALNWGYEANHPFARETARFAKFGVRFYVCPGTSTWQTLVGRHDNALANLRAAARAGKKFGATGCLITDWGDGGHPQPLAVSYLPYLGGAALSWCSRSFEEKHLIPILSREVFHDPTQRVAKAAFALGFAHQKLGVFAPNETPLGSVIAAPPPEWRELFCRHGLKHHQHLSVRGIRAALREIERQRTVLNRAKPETRTGQICKSELDLAARMAAQSCHYLLWQKAVAAGDSSVARRLAQKGIRELEVLERDFKNYWPARNKGTTARCSPFLRWRIEDYRKYLADARRGQRAAAVVA